MVARRPAWFVLLAVAALTHAGFLDDKTQRTVRPSTSFGSGMSLSAIRSTEMQQNEPNTSISDLVLFNIWHGAQGESLRPDGLYWKRQLQDDGEEQLTATQPRKPRPRNVTSGKSDTELMMYMWIAFGVMLLVVLCPPGCNCYDRHRARLRAGKASEPPRFVRLATEMRAVKGRLAWRPVDAAKLRRRSSAASEDEADKRERYGRRLSPERSRLYSNSESDGDVNSPLRSAESPVTVGMLEAEDYDQRVLMARLKVLEARRIADEKGAAAAAEREAEEAAAKAERKGWSIVAHASVSKLAAAGHHRGEASSSSSHNPSPGFKLTRAMHLTKLVAGWRAETPHKEVREPPILFTRASSEIDESMSTDYRGPLDLNRRGSSMGAVVGAMRRQGSSGGLQPRRLNRRASSDGFVGSDGQLPGRMNRRMSSEVDMSLSTDVTSDSLAGMAATPGVARPVNPRMSTDGVQPVRQRPPAFGRRMSSEVDVSLSTDYRGGSGHIHPGLLNRRGSSAGAGVLLQRQGSSGGAAPLPLNRRASSIGCDGQLAVALKRRMSSEVDMTLRTDYRKGNPAGMVAVPGVTRAVHQLMIADGGQSAGQCSHAAAPRMSSRVNESLSTNYPGGSGRIPPGLLNRRASSAGADVLQQRRGSSGGSAPFPLNRRASSMNSDPGGLNRRISSEVDMNLSTDYQGSCGSLPPAILNRRGSSAGSSRMLQQRSSSGGVVAASLCKRASSLGSSGMVQSISRRRAGSDVDLEMSTDYRGGSGAKQNAEEMSGGALPSFVRKVMRSKSASVGVESDADDELETDDELNPDINVAQRVASASTAACTPSRGVLVLRAAAAFGRLSARASTNLSARSSVPASPAHPSRSPAALHFAGPGDHAGDSSDEYGSDAHAGHAPAQVQACGVGALARIAASKMAQQQPHAERSAGCSLVAGPSYVASRPPPISLSLRDSNMSAVPLASPQLLSDQSAPRCTSDGGSSSCESLLNPRSRRGSKDAGRISVPMMAPLHEHRLSVPSSPAGSNEPFPASQRQEKSSSFSARRPKKSPAPASRPPRGPGMLTPSPGSAKNVLEELSEVSQRV